MRTEELMQTNIGILKMPFTLCVVFCAGLSNAHASDLSGVTDELLLLLLISLILSAAIAIPIDHALAKKTKKTNSTKRRIWSCLMFPILAFLLCGLLLAILIWIF